MNDFSSDPWSVLEIARDASIDEIRRAYARKLKVTRPDEQPMAFQALLQARETALRRAERIHQGTKKTSKTPKPKRHDEAKSLIHPLPAQIDPPAPSAPVEAQDMPPVKKTAREDAPPHYRKRLPDANADRKKLPPQRPPQKTPDPIAPLEATDVAIFERNLCAAEAAEEEPLDPQVLQALAKGITLLSASQRKWFEPRVIKLLGKRILANAKRRRRIMRESILNDDAFCSFAVAMGEEFGWQEADRALHPLLGTEGLRYFRQFVAAMAEAQKAKAGHPSPRQTPEGHVELTKHDLENALGPEASHFFQVMNRQGKNTPHRFKWQAFATTPFWAMRYRLYKYTALWVVAVFALGQSVTVGRFLPDALQPFRLLGLLLIAVILFGLCWRLGRSGDQVVLRRVQKLVIRADREFLFDPIVRGIRLRSQRPRAFMSDPLNLLLTIFSFAWLINGALLSSKIPTVKKPTPPPATPLQIQRPWPSFPSPPSGTGVSIPRPPVDIRP